MKGIRMHRIVKGTSSLPRVLVYLAKSWIYVGNSSTSTFIIIPSMLGTVLEPTLRLSTPGPLPNVMEVLLSPSCLFRDAMRA